MMPLGPSAFQRTCITPPLKPAARRLPARSNRLDLAFRSLYFVDPRANAGIG